MPQSSLPKPLPNQASQSQRNPPPKKKLASKKNYASKKKFSSKEELCLQEEIRLQRRNSPPKRIMPPKKKLASKEELCLQEEIFLQRRIMPPRRNPPPKKKLASKKKLETFASQIYILGEKWNTLLAQASQSLPNQVSSPQQFPSDVAIEVRWRSCFHRISS